MARLGDVPQHHSELTDPELDRIAAILRELGASSSFSAGDALTAVLSAGIVNTHAEIGSTLDDLEDAGVLRQVQKNPPRWETIRG